jgi:hypothetical protein
VGSVNDQEIKQLTGACSTIAKSSDGIAPIICGPPTKTKEPLTIGYTIRSPATTTAIGGGRYNIGGGGGGPLEQQNQQQRNEKSPSAGQQQKSFPRFIEFSNIKNTEFILGMDKEKI